MGSAAWLFVLLAVPGSWELCWLVAGPFGSGVQGSMPESADSVVSSAAAVVVVVVAQVDESAVVFGSYLC